MCRAQEWAYAALLILCFSSSVLLVGAAKPVTRPSEVDALLEIKRSLLDPNGNLSNWNRGDPCISKWTGVLCYSSTLDDNYLHVVELRLLNLSLSGNLSPALGRLSYLQVLDFMWNEITGGIPGEIGNITSLKLLLLNGNQLSGSLPENLGNLVHLDRIQIDQNHISGPIPKTFANLKAIRHFHMNNNSISGEIPSELSELPSLIHILLDNNNISGKLPPELFQLQNLEILQLDNNNFSGSTIPDSYGDMITLLKLSLRNCSLQGPIPNLSRIKNLGYLDLSNNQLSGFIPRDKFSENITTIILSDNRLTGTIPSSLSDLPLLQKLSIANNSLNGSVPSSIWQNRTLKVLDSLTVELQNNKFSNILGSIDLPQNVTVWLHGNPACSNNSLVHFCGSEREDIIDIPTNKSLDCSDSICPPPYECYSAKCPSFCVCSAPLLIGYRLKSPGFSRFSPYQKMFEEYLTNGLTLRLEQLDIGSIVWQKGPRLRMNLKLFPLHVADNNSTHMFNDSEVVRIVSKFTSWNISDSDIFGPYELLSLTISDVYKDVSIPSPSDSTMSKGALAGIILGAIAGGATLSAIIFIFIVRLRVRGHHISRRHRLSKTSIHIEGVKEFGYREMALATNNFHESTVVGQGGYGKVYKGILADGTAVAIKRAQEGSLQGEKEFLTEIQLLSRLHHRNLVALIGYCDEEDEQMLVYEFMSNGTLRDHLSVRSAKPLSFATRLKAALGAAKGILYLHTEADPPIFHRDIKSSNILLDSKYLAKVADFGLSRLAPLPDTEGDVPNHVSTVVKGTPGYLDPEYFLTHKLTDKSDVYSLGVVFLEILTGRHPISHGKNIVREVDRAYQSGKIFSIVDGQLGSYPLECVERFVTLALKCCQNETDARPSMAEVVRTLETIWLMLPESDTKVAEPPMTNVVKMTSPPSSSSNMNNYYTSEVSGSDLVSGVAPTITPR
ncbi:probable LRR receptor-like serine/threonine-protein kinase At1g06840 isoform X1 [Cucurbita moschata]|uniref:non-specific serine/threonine protein kinase n=1 Tax=Cucurbita moschata TaxID=3662 RepID=A0A6J1GB97_CUCMO|nr:probable LRR receptor-like serine/threonine-protein kinase At1g06840 isoform X1 [Cucurbita moschata]